MTPIPTELRELLERIVAGDVGRMIYAKLATGQATETDDGKAWLELRALLATPPADAADMGGQAEEGVEVVAHLMRPDFMEPYVSIRRDCSGVFVEQLMTVSQHRCILAQHRQQAGKLAEALRKLTAAMACHDSTPEEYNALAGAREALADWEKTSCGK